MISSGDILKGRILIVDDLAANVALLEQMLAQAGYSAVTSTRNPAAVAELHRAHRYDLILLDLHMPGMDGFEVLEALQKIEPGGSLPVLVITAQPQQKLRALKAGAKDFISKPFDLGEVLARVRNMLEIRLLHHSETQHAKIRLETSQRIAGLGDWEYDFVTHQLLWSDEVYHLLGIPPRSVAPDSEIFYRQVHPDDLARVHREKKAAAAGVGRVDFEHRLIRASGEVRHIHQVTGMTLDDQGQPLRESGTLQDITDHKLAEIALRESEERYRLMFEHNPSPMWVFDPVTFEFLAVNAATLALYGYSREEFMQLSARDIRPPGAVPDFLLRTAAAPIELRTVGRFQHQKKDGTVFPVDTLAHGIDFAGRPARLVLAMDMTDAEQAAAALRASETRFRALSESAPLGIFELDATGGCVYHNPALVVLTGRSVHQNLGEGWKETVHPDDRTAMRGSWARAVAEGRPWEQEQRLLRPDGTIRWVHTLAAPNKDPEGRVTGFVGTVEDITAHRQAEEELREKTALLEAQIDSSVDGILIVNPQGKRLLQNERYNTLLHIPPEVANGRDDAKAREFVMTQLREPAAVLAKVMHLYAHPREASRDELELHDGTVLDRHSLPIISKDGRVYGRIWAFRDITATKAAAVALQESEERFKFVARAVSDAVWDWNIAANTVWWNEGFFTAFGFVVGEIEPSFEVWSSRIHPDDRARIVDGLNAAVAGSSESWGAEYHFERADGTYASVQDRGYILRDAAGRGVRMVGGLRDLTEQKKMEEQYLRAQRMDSIGTLAGGIAHDLNNVLAPIMMSIELLKLDRADELGRIKILDTIHVSCRRGADLVRQVMSFARGADGQRVSIRLRHLINDLEAIISETFPRNLTITVQVANDLWPIHGDPTQIHQVLLNLTVNARDAMPNGGQLSVSASNLTLAANGTGLSRDALPGSYVLLQVSDEGSGMTPEVRNRIFEPFFTTKEVGKGTGIGLATVHTIVQSHGGFITVESEVNRGSTFKVYLPAEPAALVSGTPAPFTPELPRGRDELVLVVDDEFSIRDIMKQTLETFGYRVMIASDGAEAIALYAMRKEKISLVITDMMMPVMDGAAVIRALLAIDPDVRVLAASGIDPGRNAAKATDAGGGNFLLKPFNAETLLTLVRQVLDQAPVKTAVAPAR